MDEGLQAELRDLYEHCLSAGMDGKVFVDTMFQTAIDIALEEGDDLIARQLGHG